MTSLGARCSFEGRRAALVVALVALVGAHSTVSFAQPPASAPASAPGPAHLPPILATHPATHPATPNAHVALSQPHEVHAAPAPSPLPAAIVLHDRAHEASIAALPAGVLPARETFLRSAEAAPQFRTQVDLRLVSATPDQRKSVYSYTNKSTELVRDAERLAPEAYAAKWTSEADLGRKLAHDVEDVLHGAVPTPGIVYRGLSKVPADVVANWLKKGSIEVDAVTSTTFDPDIAIHRFAPIKAGGVSVVMVLHEKSGVAVETLAFEKDEHEVLLAKGTTFRITGASTTGDRIRIDADEQ